MKIFTLLFETTTKGWEVSRLGLLQRLYTLLSLYKNGNLIYLQ